MTEYWLSLDLSGKLGSLSLHRCFAGKEPLLLRESEMGPNTSALEHLIETLSQTLERERLKLQEIRRFLCPIGPGSFTGLRIALTTLKALASVTHPILETVNGNEIRALAWLAQNTDKPVPENIGVLTQMTAGRKVVSLFRVITHEKLETLSETLTTETLPKVTEKTVILSDQPGTQDPLEQLFYFPLRASQLAPSLEHAGSRTQYSTAQEQALLSPKYYGTSFNPEKLPIPPIEKDQRP